MNTSRHKSPPPYIDSDFVWRAKVRLDYIARRLVLEVRVITDHLPTGDSDIRIKVDSDRADVVTAWNDRRFVGTFLYLPRDGQFVDVCLDEQPYFRCEQPFARGFIEPLDLSRIDIPEDSIKISCELKRGKRLPASGRDQIFVTPESKDQSAEKRRIRIFDVDGKMVVNVSEQDMPSLEKAFEELDRIHDGYLKIEEMKIVEDIVGPFFGNADRSRSVSAFAGLEY